MKPLQTGEVLPGIYAVPNGQVNFYLVKAGQGYIAFDAGTSEQASLAELGKLNAKPEDVAAVFLTHTDGDHVGAIGLFQQAKVYISKQEEQMINGSTRRMIFMRNKLPRPYETLDDSQTVEENGLSVRCISTPGHTPGSACYLVGGKYLFSGDTFGLKDGRARLFTAIFNMDADEERRSIKKLSGLQGVEAAFTGHHGWTADFAAAFAGWA